MRRRRHDCGWLWKLRERLADELLCGCPNEDGHEAVREAAMGLAGRLVVLLDEHELHRINQQALPTVHTPESPSRRRLSLAPASTPHQQFPPKPG